MAYLRWVVLLYAGAAIGTGCSISPTIGESAAECADGRDNDDDGASDCEDSDCQALTECGGAPRRGREQPGNQIGDAYVGEPPDAGDSGPSRPADMPDAATSDPQDAGEQTDATPDATLPGCGSGCGTNQTCVLDECVDDVLVVFELWDVTRVDVYAPRSVEEGGTPCLDTACIFVPRAPFWACGCEPDPQVQFWVDPDPTDDVEAELVGETTVASARDEYRWTSPEVTLRLLPTSEITMKMVDDDGSRDEPMFGCAIPASVVTAGGPMECTALFPLGAEDATEFYIRAEVAPTQVPPE